MSAYTEKFKDPRWQKKRLEVLANHGFSCSDCGGESKTLHVHHKKYIKGREPWEYDIDEFVVLCEDCHKRLHESKDRLAEIIAEVYDADTIERIAGYVSAMVDDTWPEDLNNDDRVNGYADFFRTNVSSIKYAIGQSKKQGGPLDLTPMIYRQVVGR
jgi:hypothetical protein